MRSSLGTPEKWIVDWVDGGATSQSNIRVSEDTALNYSAFFRGVSILSNIVGMLPLKICQTMPDDTIRTAKEYPIYKIVHKRPNKYFSAIRFRQTLQAHLVTWGNAYAWIEFGGPNIINNLWILRPDRMTLEVNELNEVIYKYRFGGVNERTIPQDEIFHLPGLGYDGVKGYSLIGLAREGIGLALATERFGARYFGQGIHPGKYISYPGKLNTPDAVERLKRSLDLQHGGVDKSFKIMVLEEGAELKDEGMPPEDAQFLETRKFQVVEIARWLGLPPHLLFELDRATFSNIEHQSIEFLTFSMQPWLVLWEQEIDRQLIPEADQGEYFSQFVVEGILRGDIASRYGAYAIGRQWGWLSADDIRRLENMNALPNGEGKVYLSPLNMVPVQLLGEIKQEKKNSEIQIRMINQFRRLFYDSFNRIVRREINALQKASKRFEGNGSKQRFSQWLNEFYGELPGHIRMYLLPTVTTFNDTILDIYGKKEINVEKFSQDFVDSFAIAHSESMKTQVESILNTCNGKSGAEINSLLNTWESDLINTLTDVQIKQCFNNTVVMVSEMGVN